MPVLSEAQISQYHRDGILIAPWGLDHETVGALRAKLDQFLVDQRITDADFVPDIIERDASWLEYATRPEILDAVAQLIGPDIIVWGSALFCKAGR